MKKKKKKRIKGWNSLVDQLQIQLQHGVEEAKEEFENLKKDLAAWIDSMGLKLNKTKYIGSEKILKLKASLEELRIQAALAKAETKDEIEEQQKQIAKGIHQLRHEISETYDDSRENYEKLNDKLDGKLEVYQTRFDLFRLQLHLGKMEAEEDWEKKRKDIDKKLSHLKRKLKTKVEDIEGKWDEFSDEISKKWKQIRDMD